MALRRWKPFLGAFPLIDAAIEGADATDGLLCRDEVWGSRARIMELLRDSAGGDDDEKAEALCALLDEAMAASLATLRAVPAEKITLAPASRRPRRRRPRDDEWPRVGAGPRARRRRRARVERRRRGRARHGQGPGQGSRVFPVASSSPGRRHGAPGRLQHQGEGDPAGAGAASSEEDRRVSTAESHGPLAKKRAPTIVSNSKVKPPPSANPGAPRRLVPAQPQPHPKKMAPVAVVSSAAEEKKKLEATKRKLQERYQEAEDAKRRRTIQVIKAPRAQPGQRQRNAGPAPASRAAERCFVNLDVIVVSA
ncbi:unnamed protein product [Urochloa humidicola]